MCDSAPSGIQLLVPIVDGGHISRLERDPVERENGHIFAVVERDDVVIHMARVGQIQRRVALQLDRGLALKHDQILSASRP